MTKKTELTKSEKISLGTKEIAKRIREQLKKEFLKTKFSIRTEYYSGGSSISINVMKTNIQMIKRFEEISYDTIRINACRRGDTFEEFMKRTKEVQKLNHHQLNEYNFLDDYDEDNWNNGVFLTRDGHDLLKRVVEIVNQYNYNDSDYMSDYFDVNFYLHLSIGKWDQPMIEYDDEIVALDKHIETTTGVKI